MILDQLIYTVADGSWEASYLTPITDAAGMVQRFDRSSRNFSAVQKADFLTQLNSVSGAQLISTNDARLLAESNLATEKTAHAATQSALTAEQTAHAATAAQLTIALAKLKAAGIP